MDPHLPPEIRPLMNVYVVRLKDILGDTLLGIYLYGSIPLGTFHPEQSDIDIITLSKTSFTSAHCNQLKHIHQTLDAEYTHATRMEVIYLPFQDLGKQNTEIDPYPTYANFDSGFNPSGKANLNNVTLWQLKHKSLTLIGPNPNTLAYDIAWKDIQSTMDYNLNTYWEQRSQNPDTFLDPEETVFGVLTLCRIQHTLEHQTIISKEEAGRVALQTHDPQWYLLIQEALNLRLQPHTPSHFSSESDRAKATVQFIQDQIEACNQKYGFRP